MDGGQDLTQSAGCWHLRADVGLGCPSPSRWLSLQSRVTAVSGGAAQDGV